MFAGFSAGGFNVSVPKAGSNEYQQLEDPILKQHIRDAVSLVLSDKSSGVVAGTTSKVNELRDGRRSVRFNLLFTNFFVLAPKPGKTKCLVSLSLNGLKGGE